MNNNVQVGKYHFLIKNTLKELEKNSALEAEALMIINQIMSCSECLAKNSLCEKHSKSIKNIIVHESQKDE